MFHSGVSNELRLTEGVLRTLFLCVWELFVCSEPVVTRHAGGPGRGGCPTCLLRALLAAESSPGLPDVPARRTAPAELLQPFRTAREHGAGSYGSPQFILPSNECSSYTEPVTQVKIPDKFNATVWGPLAIFWECHNHMRPWHTGAVADFHPLNPGTEFPTNPQSLSASHQHISISFSQTDLLAKPPRSGTNCLSTSDYEALPLPRLSLKT